MPGDNNLFWTDARSQLLDLGTHFFAAAVFQRNFWLDVQSGYRCPIFTIVFQYNFCWLDFHLPYRFLLNIRGRCTRVPPTSELHWRTDNSSPFGNKVPEFILSVVVCLHVHIWSCIILAFTFCLTLFLFQPEYYTIVKYVALYIAYFNSALNPILYGGFNENFRNGFIEAFRCFLIQKRNKIGPGKMNILILFLKAVLEFSSKH